MSRGARERLNGGKEDEGERDEAEASARMLSRKAFIRSGAGTSCDVSRKS